MEHFPKIVNWFDEEENCVKEHFLDIDSTDTTTKDAVRSIVHSLLKLFPAEDIIFHDMINDSGGGGSWNHWVMN